MAIGPLFHLFFLKKKKVTILWRSGPQGSGRAINPKVSLRPASKDLNIMYMYYYYIVLF